MEEKVHHYDYYSFNPYFIAMKHRYYLTWVTCSSCEEKIRNARMSIGSVQSVNFVNKQTVDITMDTHVSVEELQTKLNPLENYTVTEKEPENTSSLSWLTVYRPLAMVFAIIALLTVLDHVIFSHSWGWDSMMRFMGRWFVVFALLKLINLPWFVDGFKSYDVLASRSSIYAWAYPFIELILGICFIIWFRVLWSSIVTLFIMVVGTVWIVNALWRKLQCACIGSFFKLPLTKVTVFENIVMALMAVVMIGKSVM